MSSGSRVDPRLMVRPYNDADEAEVLELLRGSLGGGPAGERTPDFFRWKHLENPFGRSFMIVAESDRRIVGFRAMMRWRFRCGDRVIEAVRPVDTATHPDYRGRGVFSTLTKTALESLRDEVDVVFNTPNRDSLPGYLKMGWQIVGKIHVSVRVCTPIVRGLLRGGSSEGRAGHRPQIAAPPAADALSDDRSFADLNAFLDAPPQTYSTPLSVELLRWRYGDAPLLGYHVVRERDDRGLSGIAFFRARREGSLWGLVISQVLVRPGDVRTARRLLARARRSADVAYVASVFPFGSAAAQARRGTLSVRAPRTLTFVVHPLTAGLSPDPRELSSWALSTCDVEVF